MAEFSRRVADEISMADFRIVTLQSRQPARLGETAGDPVDGVEAGERFCRRVGVCGLGIIDEQHAPEPPDLLHAVGQAWEALETSGDFLARQADGAAECKGGSGILGIMRAAQRAYAGKANGREGFAALDFDQRAVMGVNALAQRA